MPASGRVLKADFIRNLLCVKPYPILTPDVNCLPCQHLPVLTVAIAKPHGFWRGKVVFASTLSSFEISYIDNLHLEAPYLQIRSIGASAKFNRTVNCHPANAAVQKPLKNLVSRWRPAGMTKTGVHALL
jgi:hypothetical protein